MFGFVKSGFVKVFLFSMLSHVMDCIGGEIHLILNFVGNVSAARDGQSLLRRLAYQAVIQRQITADILITICP